MTVKYLAFLRATRPAIELTMVQVIIPATPTIGSIAFTTQHSCARILSEPGLAAAGCGSMSSADYALCDALMLVQPSSNLTVVKAAVRHR
jgi:hypothetical protein